MSRGQGTVNGAYWLADGSGVPASEINSTLFTHLFCAFAELIPGTNSVTIPDSIAEFTKTVRRNNQNVKTLLSIGGGNFNPTIFSNMASQSSSRKSFIDSSISVARSNGFSGLDLDWEHPTTKDEMDNLGSLLKEWRAAVTTEAASSSQAPLLLTAAFHYLPKRRIENSDDWMDYPIQAIRENLDWVNVMAYDLYGPTPDWSPVTNAHSALNDPTVHVVSGSHGIQEWMDAGIPADKLVLGMPFYGRAWLLFDSLLNPNDQGFGKQYNGPPNGYEHNDGYIPYKDVKNFILNTGAAQGYKADIVSNYCSSGKTWIGYDDVESISAKVSYAKKEGLRGYFAWEVSQDLEWALSERAKDEWEATEA